MTNYFSPKYAPSTTVMYVDTRGNKHLAYVLGSVTSRSEDSGPYTTRYEIKYFRMTEHGSVWYQEWVREATLSSILTDDDK